MWTVEGYLSVCESRILDRQETVSGHLVGSIDTKSESINQVRIQFNFIFYFFIFLRPCAYISVGYLITFHFVNFFGLSLFGMWLKLPHRMCSLAIPLHSVGRKIFFFSFFF